MKRAANNSGSRELDSPYESFIICFAEIEEQCERRITSDERDKLIYRATIVPHHFGLASSKHSTEACTKTCDQFGENVW